MCVRNIRHARDANALWMKKKMAMKNWGQKEKKKERERERSKGKLSFLLRMYTQQIKKKETIAGNTLHKSDERTHKDKLIVKSYETKQNLEKPTQRCLQRWQTYDGMHGARTKSRKENV